MNSEIKIVMSMTQEILYEKDLYRTADLALASTILLFYPLEAIDRQNPRKAQFLFKQTDALDQLVERYWKGDLMVEPQAYFNQLRIIKSRLYNEA